MSGINILFSLVPDWNHYYLHLFAFSFFFSYLHPLFNYLESSFFPHKFITFISSAFPSLHLSFLSIYLVLIHPSSIHYTP